jgi:hypothetical protein
MPSPRDLLRFLREHRIAVTDRFEIVFDTLDSTRKARYLRDNQHIALVIGGVTPGDERTAQYEGIADVPDGEELRRLTAVYYTVHSDGRRRASWPGLIYVRVRPTWIRYSDYNVDPPLIVEVRADQLVV